MSYLVLARKYRPTSFDSVSGQEHVTRTLANAIKRGKIAHAYLFCGLRGVGKTSIARIFAKALNCEHGPTVTPCGVCTNCQEIANGTSLAVREIDGASHNSVDNVRDLIESFRSLPPMGSRNKIYIIDEVHMLSISAFNALLKSLEEPPPNTIFILATTDPQKIPQTVISRCQRYDFRALTFDEITDCLKNIAEKEGLTVEPEVFRMIARLAEGSMRDAQSLFDRVQSFCENNVSVEEAGQVLGVVDKNVLLKLSKAIFNHDSALVIDLVEQAFSTGLDPALFLKEFATHWRELLLAKFGGEKALKGIGISQDNAKELLDQVALASKQDIQDLAQIGREGADRALRSLQPKYALEALVIRMANREDVKDIEDLLIQLRSVISNGTAGRVAAQPQVTQNITAQKKTLNPNSTLEKEPSDLDNQKEKVPPVENKEVRKDLSWADFVATEKFPVFAEQLKRLSLLEFSLGKLIAKGTEFNISYLKRPESIKRLKEALLNYSNFQDWRIDLSVSGDGEIVSDGSLRDEEKKRMIENQKKKVEQIKKNPVVKSILETFPNSKIEHMNVR